MKKKLHQRIIEGFITPIPDLLKEAGYKGILREKLYEIRIPKQKIRKIHNTFIITMYGQLPIALILIIFKQPLIAIIPLTIFITMMQLMTISWFIFGDCPYTIIEEKQTRLNGLD